MNVNFIVLLNLNLINSKKPYFNKNKHQNKMSIIQIFLLIADVYYDIYHKFKINFILYIINLKLILY